MKTLSIDIETYSDVPLQKTGVYRYCESPEFEILLFAYSVDNAPVQVVDLACGEKIPDEVLAALKYGKVSRKEFLTPYLRSAHSLLKPGTISWRQQCRCGQASPPF